MIVAYKLEYYIKLYCIKVDLIPGTYEYISLHSKRSSSVI